MGQIGTGEVILVLIVALVVLGPEKLPKVARQVGQFVGDLRRYSNDIRSQVDQAISQSDDGATPSDERPKDQKHPGTEGFRLIDERPADIVEVPLAGEPEPSSDDLPSEPKAKRDPLDPDRRDRS